MVLRKHAFVPAVVTPVIKSVGMMAVLVGALSAPCLLPFALMGVVDDVARDVDSDTDGEPSDGGKWHVDSRFLNL
ncbi:hypothetical protein AB0D27_44160 [Streptomyces sp. NPDC048415]|uniref:hypothetical protein n=1 Tax=Streptomyces sp. NPDC048415 TaxID=3154822 RepID=UPI00343F734E